MRIIFWEKRFPFDTCAKVMRLPKRITCCSQVDHLIGRQGLPYYGSAFKIAFVDQTDASIIVAVGWGWALSVIHPDLLQGS